MQPAKSILLRMATLVPCVALALVVSACDGNKNTTLPTAPLSPTAPPPPTTLPASEEATPGTYRRATPLHGGSVEESYAIDPNGRFRLQYRGAPSGLFEYLGSYSRQSTWYVFDFDDWSAAGPLQAVASFRGNCVVVEYNMVMALSDFEGGEFCR